MIVKIIGVRFKTTGKVYYFDPQDFEVNRGDHVIVETVRGLEYGEVIRGVREVEDTVVTKPLKGVMRIATEDDTRIYKENKEKEAEAYKICCKKIDAHGLDMKLVEVEYTFDRSKILFYFTSDGRVDFRELVKDLASVFKTRIELRQIGVRDESKTLGSIGVCGRDLCCSRFLGEFVPVSIKMAKEQGLSLNPTKISGACGRLMCCLKYEQETYEALHKEIPSSGTVVNTPDGKGTITDVALLKGMVRVRFENDGEVSQKDYSVNDVYVCDGKGKPEQKEDGIFPEVVFKNDSPEEKTETGEQSSEQAQDEKERDKAQKHRPRHRRHRHKSKNSPQKTDE